MQQRGNFWHISLNLAPRQDCVEIQIVVPILKLAFGAGFFAFGTSCGLGYFKLHCRILAALVRKWPSGRTSCEALLCCSDYFHYILLCCFFYQIPITIYKGQIPLAFLYVRDDICVFFVAFGAALMLTPNLRSHSRRLMQSGLVVVRIGWLYLKMPMLYFYICRHRYACILYNSVCHDLFCL